MDSKQNLKDRFLRNLLRVRGLIAASSRLETLAGGGDVEAPADILRAAIVLLHATMEDLLRTLEEFTLLQAASPAILKTFGIAYGGTTPEKLTLYELAAAYPDQTINDVVLHAIFAYLDRKTYNNRDELAGVLKRVELPAKSLMDRFAGDLEAMMRRRHKVVHRADLMSFGFGLVLHGLRPNDVESWADVVDQFGNEVLDQYQGARYDEQRPA